MEAVLRNSTGEYNRRIGNPNRKTITNRTLYSFPSDDLANLLIGGQFDRTGLLSLTNSYPPAISVFRAHGNQPQPPLLPLPISMPVNHLNMNINRSNSCCSNVNTRINNNNRINKNVKNRGRDHSTTPKKSKNQKKMLKNQEVGPVENEVIVGPDPKDLPKHVFASSDNYKLCDVDKFSGSVVFTPSPPPSSLPLPSFMVRPKLIGCNVQAAGVDAGATDSLRRLLRL